MIEVRVGRLVLEGVEPADAERVAAGFTADLRRALVRRSLDPAGRAREAVELDRVPASPRDLGAAAAAAVAKGLPL